MTTLVLSEVAQYNHSTLASVSDVLIQIYGYFRAAFNVNKTNKQQIKTDKLNTAAYTSKSILNSHISPMVADPALHIVFVR